MQLLDIEVYPNYFLLGIESYETKIKYDWSLNTTSDTKNIENWSHIENWLQTTHVGPDSFVVTFNGEHYDLPVLAYLKSNIELFEQYYGPNSENLNTHDLEAGRQLCLTKLKMYSDDIINTRDYNHAAVMLVRRYMSKNFTHIDLLLHWATMIRLQKKISLKSLAIQLNYPHIQELPYPPDKPLSQTEQIEVQDYCLNNDLGILRMLLDDRKEDVRLRAVILTSFNITCWSLDAVKIASEYLLNEYCKQTGQNKYDVSKQRFPKNNFKIKTVIPEFKFETKLFQDVYEEVKEGDVSFSKKFILNSNGNYVKISIGIGGIHSLLENRTIVIPEGYKLITSDIALKRGK